MVVSIRMGAPSRVRKGMYKEGFACTATLLPFAFDRPHHPIPFEGPSTHHTSCPICPPPDLCSTRPPRRYALGMYVFMWMCMIAFAVIVFFEQRLNARYGDRVSAAGASPYVAVGDAGASPANDGDDDEARGLDDGEVGHAVTYELMDD